MPASVETSEQISFVESGLKSLKRSWLMGAREFKDMYSAMERHHRDIKLAHLTGKAKDLLEQAYKDNRFFNILMKMMIEVHVSSDRKRAKQRQDLKKIYSWYQANKHVLHCESHFGKAQQKEKANQVFKHKLVTKVVKPKIREEEESIPQHFFDNDIYSLADDSRSTTPSNIQGRLSQSSYEPPPRYKEPRPATAPTSSGLSYPPRAGRPKSAAVDFEFKNEPKVTVEEDGLPDNIIHPLRSLINPHLQMNDYERQQALLETGETGDITIQDSRSSSPVKIQIDGTGPTSTTLNLKRRPKTAIEDKQEKLNQWQEYQDGQKIQQGELGGMQLCGRSGTPYDLRYSAHESGESPEYNTNAILHNYAKSAKSDDSGERKRSLLIAQSLETFYKSAENYYPLQKQRPSAAKVKPKSAPPCGRRVSFANSSMKSQKNSKGSNVKLNTVLNLVNDVTTNMLQKKERLNDVPIPSYKYASASVSKISRPKTAPTTLNQHQHHNTPSHTPRHSMHESSPILNLQPPIESPYTVHFQKEVSEDETSQSPIHQAVDWRGQITPDTARYKWSPSRFGGHTYVKKLKQVKSLRSQGGTHAGSRPKTASQSVQDKWKTQKSSDTNKKVIQAASHMTTEVDSDVVNQMMQVHYLGTGENRVPSGQYDQDSLYQLGMPRGGSATYTQRGQSASSREYMSFVAPKSLLDTVLKPQRNISTPDNTARDTYSLPPETELSTLISSPVTQTMTSTLGDYLSMVSSMPRNMDNASDKAYSTSGGYDVPDINDLDDELGGSSFRDDIDSRDGDFSVDGEMQDQVEDSPLADEYEIVQAEPAMEVAALDETRSLASSLTQISESASVAGDVLTPNIDVNIVNKNEVSISVEADTTDADVEVSETFTEQPVCTCNHSVEDDDLLVQGTSMKAGKQMSNISKLSTSQHWSYSPDTSNEQDPSKLIRGEHWTHAIKRPENYCKVCRPKSVKFAPIKGQRTPGGPPPTERILLHREQHHPTRPLTAPHKTSPSIPSPHCAYGVRSPRYGHTYNPELDHHALRVRSPRHFMETIGDLRSVERGAEAHGMQQDVEDLSLMLNVQRIGSKPEDQFLEAMKEQSCVEGSSSQGVQAEEVSQRLDLNKNECIDVTLASKKGNSGSVISKRSLASVGRPIAHCHNIKDPDQEAEAALLLKQASAAVDIQRIFRGYVARNMYNKLLTEEREVKEDERKAAIEIQRTYRGHVSRKNAIYTRKPDCESIEWARNFKAIQAENAIARAEKAAETSREITKNRVEAVSKLSIIGPHVEMYEIFHPVKSGPIKSRLKSAAIIIQKHVRGWLVRRMFEALKRKAKIHAQSWEKFVSDYKDLLVRIQRRHGVNRPSRPFDPDHLNKFMDLKRRYESVFEKRAFGGELEKDEFSLYFKECDLYPSEAEMEHALDIVFKFQKRKTQKGYTKKEMMEVTFQIFTPEGTGLKDTRRSTWMHPIVDEEDAMQMQGNEAVEAAPLGICMDLVAASMRERKEKANVMNAKVKEEEERIEEAERKKRAKQIQQEIENEDKELRNKLMS